jgi:GT2 family glycosyltransferase
MDATTFLEDPDKFFKYALSFFEKDNDLVGITGKLKVIPKYETFADKVIHKIINTVVMLKNNYLSMTEASGKFEMIKRSAFEKVGGFDDQLITREDSNMFEKLSKVGKTRYIGSLEILYTGRRAHILGWPKLLFIWMSEAFWVWIFGKARVKVWKVVR